MKQRALQVLKHFKGAIDGFVHVVILVVAKATEEVDIAEFGTGGLKVLLVQGGIGVAGDGVIWLVFTALVGRGILEGNYGFRRLVIKEVLVLADAREIIIFRIVHHGVRLEKLTVVGAKIQLNTTVRQVAEAPVHEFVDRASVEDALALSLAFDVVPMRAGLHGDARVGQHLFDHGGVAVQRDTLPAILEVAVVAADIHRHTTRDSGVELFRLYAPLFHGIDEENLLVDVFRKEVEIFVVGFAQFENGNFLVESEALHELVFKTACHRLGEYLTDRIQVEGDGDELAVDKAQHLMHVRMPSREA